MISLRNLSLQRGPKLLFDQLNLTLYAGQKVGFIGTNGSGKSSLFSLLLGELVPDAGEVELPTHLTITQVAQELPSRAMPAIDYVLEGDLELSKVEAQLREAQPDGLREASLHAHWEALGGYSARARAAQLMHGLGFASSTLEQPVHQFSGGWRVRLNLARTLMCRSEVLLLDEPTNHLDLDAVLWFEQWLKRYAGTLLLISHDRDFLNNVVATIAHLDNRKITLYSGNYDDFERQKAAQLALQQATYQKQQTAIAHIQTFVNRFRYKATKAKQAQSRLNMLAKMAQIAPAHVDSPFHFSFPPLPNLPNQLINLEKVSVGYGHKTVLEKVSLRVTAGLRLGLLGPNGAGKSTLIKLLAGLLTSSQGEFKVGEQARIGYFAQHQLELLRAEETPLQHLAPPASEQVMRNFLGGFGFAGEQAVVPVAAFSGGEKARLVLALLAWQQPNVLLLDEPTNHLDLEMRQALTLALQEYEGALIIVSHDRHLLRTTTDELLLVAQGRVKNFAGDLEDYRQWLLGQRSNKMPRPAKQRPETQRRPLQNRLKQVEKELDKLSAEKAAIEELLANPDIYTQKEQVTEYLRQQAQVAEQLQQVEENWLTITEALEAFRV